ncbi:hypothetical protein J2T50_000293 [Streptococcus gallinaceus]|uniref:hypothetical protein n=1 Tax=Streptococcus gallinaceus TaxID=165758 RepID=UPI00209FC3EF|nr:hypothetical protein [Streptococcus gallinaceus]MCP1638600.1 hypothetical protein [Streptococcus gallinaceus]MCP1769313.1 hypothetical protein [Streptococcus gallinaceus]
MDKREEVKQVLKQEIHWATKFSEYLKHYVDNNERRKVDAYAEKLKLASRCLMDTHTDFWEVTNGEMTDAEFELFSNAEVVFHQAIQTLRYYKENRS